MLTIEDINNFIKHKNLKVLSFYNEQTSLKKTKCIVFCLIHGDTSKWGNPWIPTIESIKRDVNCPKCREKYVATKEEVKQQIINKLDDNLYIIDFSNYEKKTSKINVGCKIHGDGKKWNTPWNPSVKGILQHNYGCPKCSKKYKSTEKDYVEEINSKLKNSHLSLIKIIDFKNNKSRCILECKYHGDTSQWENPWTISINDIMTGYGCPKCSNQYQYTAKELIDIINNSPIKNPKISVYGVYKGKGYNSLMLAECSQHGKGENFDKPWYPRSYHLKKGHGCPICKQEQTNVNELLKGLKNNLNKRYLYFIKFKSKNKNIFKIGLNSSKNIFVRFSKKKLKDNGFTIEVIDHLEINNIVAILTENYILNKYKKDKKYFHLLRETKLDGATECFGTNILKNSSLILEVEEMKKNIEFVLNNFDIKENEKKEIIKIIK